MALRLALYQHVQSRVSASDLEKSVAYVTALPLDQLVDRLSRNQDWAA